MPPSLRSGLNMAHERRLHPMVLPIDRADGLPAGDGQQAGDAAPQHRVASDEPSCARCFRLAGTDTSFSVSLVSSVWPERLVYTERVGSSNLSRGTISGGA
jgi:hypothetical protein